MNDMNQVRNKRQSLNVISLFSASTCFSLLFSYFAISKTNTGNSSPYVCETFLLMHLFRIDPSSCLPDKVFQGFLIPATFRISSRFWDVTYANPSFRFMPPLFSPSQISPQYFFLKDGWQLRPGLRLDWDLLWQLQLSQLLSTNNIQVQIFPCAFTGIRHSSEQIYKFSQAHRVACTTLSKLTQETDSRHPSL